MKAMTVRITKARRLAWYTDRIGALFEVYPAPRKDSCFVLKEDYDEDYAQIRYLLREDCEEVEDAGTTGHYEANYGRGWKTIKEKQASSAMKGSYVYRPKAMSRLRAGEIISTPSADYRYVKETTGEGEGMAGLDTADES